MTEERTGAAWEPCTTCGEYRPTFAYVYEVPDDATTAKPYCHGCAVHRMKLEVFPHDLADIPIVDVSHD